MQEQPRLVPVEEELQDGLGDREVQVERAVDELELAEAAVEERPHRGEEIVQRHVAHGDVEGRQAKLTLERAPPRGLNVNDAVGEVVVGVEGVGESDGATKGRSDGGECLQSLRAFVASWLRRFRRLELRQLRGDYLLQRAPVREDPL